MDRDTLVMMICSFPFVCVGIFGIAPLLLPGNGIGVALMLLFMPTWAYGVVWVVEKVLIRFRLIAPYINNKA